jgi:hypothetical protein
MRGRSGLTFQKYNGLFVLHILAGILRHEYNGAEYNLLDCTVTGEKTIVGFGKINQGNNQVQLYKCFHMASAWSFASI